MKIRNDVRIQIPIAEVWTVLNDIPRVARCAPGAELLESRPDDSHVGTIGVKLGPIALKFKGTVSFIERDAAKYSEPAAANREPSLSREEATRRDRTSQGK